MQGPTVANVYNLNTKKDDAELNFYAATICVGKKQLYPAVKALQKVSRGCAGTRVNAYLQSVVYSVMCKAPPGSGPQTVCELLAIYAVFDLPMQTKQLTSAAGMCDFHRHHVNTLKQALFTPSAHVASCSLAAVVCLCSP